MRLIYLLSFVVLFTLFSCAKEEGEGGKNYVHGYVIENWFDVNETFLGAHPALEKPVYIIYGATASYSNVFNTHFNGSYNFDKLRKGNYTIFSYEDCFNCPDGKQPVFLDFELRERKEDVELDTLFVRRIVD